MGCDVEQMSALARIGYGSGRFQLRQRMRPLKGALAPPSLSSPGSPGFHVRALALGTADC